MRSSQRLRFFTQVFSRRDFYTLRGLGYGIAPETTGVMFFDAFESRRESYIGLDPAIPVTVE